MEQDFGSTGPPIGAYVIGVDVGGTRLRVALADRQGQIIRQRTVDTNAQEGRDAVIGRIVAQVRAVLDPLPLPALRNLAVGLPGPVDPFRGIVFRPPNLPGWGDVPLESILTEQLGVPVTVGNDANLAALAEHRFGAGQGIDHLVYFTVSTGIGAGVIEQGRLVLGAWGGAAEIGHTTIDLNGPRCSCGNYGCLEAMASGSAIAKETTRRIAHGRPSALVEEVGHEGRPLTGAMVAAAAEAGDPLSREVVEWAGYNLGVGLANAMFLFDPQRIVVGGGISNAWDLIEPALWRAIRERAMETYYSRTAIVRAALGDAAGAQGAVALALQEVRL
jgi:glucokinase